MENSEDPIVSNSLSTSSSTLREGTPPPAVSQIPTQHKSLQNRSCDTCRNRKVKCDKQWPCSACSKAKRKCLYIDNEPTTSHTRRLIYRDLRKRLADLEAVVEKIKPASVEHGDGISEQFGQLTIDDRGKSRYFNSSFWTCLSFEVQNLHSALEDQNQGKGENYIAPNAYAPDLSNSLIFSFSSQVVNSGHQHPVPSIIDQLWDIYIINFDPMVKIIHKPTLSVAISEAKADLDHISKDLEALMYAIYFGAIITLKPEEVQHLFRAEPSEVVARYRLLLEQALARAEIIQSQDILTFEAFLIYLNCQLCVRKHDDTRSVWRMTGLAVRIAQSLGLHRDGTRFNLSPFDVEIRRRLWWQVLIMDVRAADDHGSDLMAMPERYDTKLPSNLNDEDIGPESNEIPQALKEHTDITFSLLRFEMNDLLYRLHHVSPTSHGPSRLASSVEVFESWNKKLEEKYVRPFDSSVPIQVVTMSLCKLIMAKIWLIIHHPLHAQSDRNVLLSEQSRDALFMISRKLIEHSLMLEESSMTSRWNWFFQTYFPWHAVLFILIELCYSQRKVPDADKAWKLVESILSSRNQPMEDILTMGGREHVWQLLKRLMAKASSFREREMSRQMTAREGFEEPESVQQQPNAEASQLVIDSQMILDGGFSTIPPHQLLEPLQGQLPVEEHASLDYFDLPNQFETFVTTDGAGWEDLDSLLKDFEDEVNNGNGLPGLQFNGFW